MQHLIINCQRIEKWQNKASFFPRNKSSQTVTEEKSGLPSTLLAADRQYDDLLHLRIWVDWWRRVNEYLGVRDLQRIHGNNTDCVSVVHTNIVITTHLLKITYIFNGYHVLLQSICLLSNYNYHPHRTAYRCDSGTVFGNVCLWLLILVFKSWQ